MTKLTIPESQSELEELLADGSKVQNLMTEGQFPEVVKAYAKHVADSDADLHKQVKEQTQQILAEYLRENDDVKGLEALKRGGQNAVAKRATDPTLYNAKASGAKLDNEFGDMAEFFQTIWHNTHSGPAVDAKRATLKNAAASSGEPAGGGFLVPEAFRAELLKLSLETGVVRPRARIVPMETSRVLYPTVDETSHVSNVFGGVQAYWTPESGQMQDVAAKFSRIALEAWKLTAFANVPNELISDSAISFETYMRTAFPEALAYFEDDAFVNGNGVGQPLGFLQANAAVEVTRSGAGAIAYEDIVAMYSRMLPQSLSRAVWIVSPDVFPELATMSLTVGSGGGPVWLASPSGGPSAANTPPMTILGRPVIVSEKVPALGTPGDINFVDLNYYLIGDRQAMTVESSPHYRFQNGETSYKFVSRVDGRPWIQSALTPRNGGDTLSPFVKLDAGS